MSFPVIGADMVLAADERIVHAVTLTEHIARCFADDLLPFVRAGQVDVRRSLGINDDGYLRDGAGIVELLCHDLHVMQDDAVIAGAHFLLCAAPAGGVVRVGYHAEYQLPGTRPPADPPANASSASAPPPRLPRVVGDWPLFVLAIDWDPYAPPDALALLCPPRYLFRWTPPRSNDAQAHIIRYQSGGLSSVGVQMRAPGPDDAPGVADL